MSTESKTELVVRREEVLERLKALGAGTAQAVERVQLQAELTVIKAKLRTLNVVQAEKDRVAAEKRRRLGKLEHEANLKVAAARPEWAGTWDNDGTPLETEPATKGKLAVMIWTVMERPDDEDALISIAESDLAVIAWLCQHVPEHALLALESDAEALL